MKKGFWLLVLLVLIAGLFWYLRMGRYREIEGIEIPGGLTLTTSLAELPGSAAQGALVYYKGFTLSFNNQTHQANWVAYELTREEVVHRAAERSDRFRKDTLPNLMTASNIGIGGSGKNVRMKDATGRRRCRGCLLLPDPFLILLQIPSGFFRCLLPSIKLFWFISGTGNKPLPFYFQTRFWYLVHRRNMLSLLTVWNG